MHLILPPSTPFPLSTSRELAQQKKEKEDREKANQPRERDSQAEQAAAIAEIRRKEEESGEVEVRQRNEAGLQFLWDEDSRPGFVVLDVGVPRHLDSSLIDVDVHPLYISVVIKSKLLRLRHPAEVKASEATCQRSKATGHLLVIMPKLNSKENIVTSRGNVRHAAEQAAKAKAKPAPARKLTMQEQMMQLAMEEAAKTNQKPSATAESASLTDCSFIGHVGGGAAADVRSIVKKVPAKEEAGVTVFELGAVSTGGGHRSLVEELD